jgi:hypothetical protein
MQKEFMKLDQWFYIHMKQQTVANGKQRMFTG